MPEAPLLPQSPLQAQIARMALELAARLEREAEQAPPGSVVDACESLLLGQGRQFLRDSLAAALQAQIDSAEKKGGRRGPVPAARPAGTRGPARASS